MNYSPEQAEFVLAEINRTLALNEPTPLKVRRVWHNMALLRGYVLAAMLQNTIGNAVHSGPFKGMKLTPDVMQGAFGPTLLGTYEHELHATVEEIVSQPYRHTLNIGCAYGYYSVGLALRMPHVKVHAFDISEKARRKCADMIALNGMQDRVTLGGEFKGEDFAAYEKERTLAIVDIEGAEMQLLDPTRYPALRGMDLLVELHDLYDPAISDAIASRFAATHDIELIRNKTMLADLQQAGGAYGYVDPFDSLIMTWEERDGPTPWAMMRAKQPSGS